MSEQMQKFGHRDSRYSRPTQKWQCGHMDACKAGPGLNGECPLKDNPCSPILSVKTRKRRVVFLMLGLVISLLFILLTGNATLNYLSPGPLSVNHAEVASCEDCHSAVSESILDWVNKGIHLNNGNDDKKCLSCHKLGDNASLPHSTSPNNFSIDTDLGITPPKASSDWAVNIASLLRELQTKESDEVSCAVCHREHQGEFVPIDGFNPQQCHVCHAVKFTNLELEHPLYTQFPYDRPTRIRFDHVSHLKKHFVEDEYIDLAPDGCKQCHDTDQSGEWMLSNTFEASCSSCHLEEILGDTRIDAKGVAVLSIPEIDIRSLADAGYFVGQWPEWADGEMTLFMQLLLPEPLQNSAALQNKSLDLFDLSSASPEEMRSVAELAWGIKELFYDIQMGGTALMNRRIAAALKSDFDQSTLNHLVASLPKDTLVNNQKEWFPTLIEEIKQYRSGKIEIFVGVDLENGAPVESSEQNVGAPRVAESQDILIEDEADILLDDDSSISSLSDDELIESEILDRGDTDRLREDDDLVEDSEHILVADEESLLLDDDDAPNADLREEADAEHRFGGVVESAVDNEEWARSGGWYRDGSEICYRPVDHADPFLKTWLEVSSAKNDPIGKMLFASLNDEDAVGRCVKCHSVESKIEMTKTSNSKEQLLDEAAEYQINWHGFKPDDVVVDFNRFSHISHFGLMNDDGCSNCHKLNSATPEKSDILEASFADMDNETCTQCHQRGRAPDNCLTCHNYHVEQYARSIELISDSLRGEQ